MVEKVKLSKRCSVTNFGQPYIIAEIASNHNGDMGLAKEMIRSAKDAGADAVKFQSWTKKSLFAEKIFAAERRRGLKQGAKSLEDQIDEYAISFQELAAMKKAADRTGIDFICTPFSPDEVDFLVDRLDVPMIKIASMDANNYPFLAYAARKGRPIILSTGLCTLAEIDSAVRTIEEAGNRQIVIRRTIRST
jgi:N-acetylneuraminate synthase